MKTAKPHTPPARARNMLPSAEPPYRSNLSHVVEGKPQPVMVAESVRELPSHLNRLANEIGYLEHVVDELANRLEPVLSPRPNGLGCEGNSDPSPPQSPLSNEVENSANRVIFLRLRLDQLTGSLAI